jgi:hypothetical protein
MLWVTREGVKVDRLATIWLIKRFVDKDADIRFVPSADVQRLRAEEGARGFHVKGTEFAKDDDRTGFEALLDAEHLTDKHVALKLMADMVNAADTVNALHNPQPAGPGLRAITDGMRRQYSGKDQAVVDGMMPVFDALYAYCEAHA